MAPSFPLGDEDVALFADAYLDMRPILAPYDGLIDLYRPNGFQHWREFSHVLAGIELGDHVLEWFPPD